jgi:putative membrane protein
VLTRVTARSTRGAVAGAAALVALVPARSSAHGPPALEHWALLDAATLGLLGVGLLVYVTGLACSSAAARRRRRGGTLALFGGYLALVIATLSPLDTWAEVSVTAHMAQHLLLVVVAAPLLVLARPWQVGLRVVSPARRRSVAVALASIVRAAAALAPLVWGLHVAVLWVWHAPSLWVAAQAAPPLHALQHGAFFGTALLFWWIVLDGRARRQLGPVGSLVFLFTGAAQSTALGALLVVAERPWYADGVGALDDQQLAGVLMWMPAGVAYLVAALAILRSVLGRRGA